MVPQLLHPVSEHFTRTCRDARSEWGAKRLRSARCCRVHNPVWTGLHRILRLHPIRLETSCRSEGFGDRRDGSLLVRRLHRADRVGQLLGPWRESKLGLLQLPHLWHDVLAETR